MQFVYSNFFHVAFFFLNFFPCLQFKPVLVKKDQEQTQTDKSGKLVTNGRGGNKEPDPAAVESSSSVSSPQASA